MSATEEENVYAQLVSEYHARPEYTTQAHGERDPIMPHPPSPEQQKRNFLEQLKQVQAKTNRPLVTALQKSKSQAKTEVQLLQNRVQQLKFQEAQAQLKIRKTVEQTRKLQLKRGQAKEQASMLLKEEELRERALLRK